MQEAQSSLPLGSIIQGRYVVESVLGKGSSGAVYLVRNQQNQQHLFALKEIINSRRKERYRYTFESTKLPRLDHPALPLVYDVFKDGHDRAYILMEYIEGSNLEVARLQQQEQRFPLSQVTALIAPIMEAVTYLHSQHPPIIHLNIKPSSIIETKADTSAVLVGFGHEKEYDPEETITLVRHATSSYGAPEQYVEVISTRTDIYALGATLYTLLTGIVPPDSLYRTKKLDNKEPDPLVPMNHLTPTPIAEAILCAMSINSDDRFSTVEHFCEALRQTSNPITIEQQPIEHIATVPIEEHTELDFNPPVQKVVESVVEVREASSLTVDPVVQHVTMSPQEPTHISSFKKHGMAFLTLFAVIVTLCASLGVGTSLWAFIAAQHRSISVIPTSTPQSMPKLASTPVSTIYPLIAGTYNGTIYDISSNVSTSLSLTEVRQSQGKMSGYLVLGSGLQGSGPFSGTIDTTKNLQFIVMDAAGNAMLFFEGAMQSSTSLSGDYYRCLPGPHQGGQCSKVPGSFGIWNVVLD